jgi:hypothetical protein
MGCGILIPDSTYRELNDSVGIILRDACIFPEPSQSDGRPEASAHGCGPRHGDGLSLAASGKKLNGLVPPRLHF